MRQPRIHWLLSWLHILQRNKYSGSYRPPDIQMVWPRVFPKIHCPSHPLDAAFFKGCWDHLGDSGSLWIFIPWKVMASWELKWKQFGGFVQFFCFWPSAAGFLTCDPPRVRGLDQGWLLLPTHPCFPMAFGVRMWLVWPYTSWTTGSLLMPSHLLFSTAVMSAFSDPWAHHVPSCTGCSLCLEHQSLDSPPHISNIISMVTFSSKPSLTSLTGPNLSTASCHCMLWHSILTLATAAIIHQDMWCFAQWPRLPADSRLRWGEVIFTFAHFCIPSTWHGAWPIIDARIDAC